MTNSGGFNFEHWVSLARDDPEEFEKQRKLMIDALISSSPEHLQQRLQGMQWQIDLLRHRSKTPLAACIKISSMMWDHLLGDNGLVEAIEHLRSGPTSMPARPTEDARILSFPQDSDEPSDIPGN